MVICQPTQEEPEWLSQAFPAALLCPSLSLQMTVDAILFFFILFFASSVRVKTANQDALFSSFHCPFSQTPVNTDSWDLTAFLFQIPYLI